MKRFTLFLFVLIRFLIANAQSSDKYLSPGFSIGYCISTHGISYGLDLDFGIGKKTIADHQMNYGVSLSKNWHRFKLRSLRGWHNQTMLNFMVENKDMDLKFGIGQMRNPHGYGNNVLCRVNGFNYDLSFTQPNYLAPWVGVKGFHYRRKNWRWLDQPYFTPYTKYKYDFGKSGLKN